MTTLDELVKCGIEKKNAERMVQLWEKRIGEKHGINTITDIVYNGMGEGSTVYLTCQSCGKVRTKDFKNSRNKWAELAKTCSCQKRVLSNKEVAVRKEYNNNPEFVGKSFGNLTVVEILERPKANGKSGKAIQWVCECSECHKRRVLAPSRVKNGKAECKCANKKPSKYIGARFGRLVVKEMYAKNTSKRFICECDCGEIYDGDANAILRGKVKSCGCLAREIHENAKYASPLWHTWSNMIARCEKPNGKAWDDYGGRGIRVCDEWHDFKTFEEWAIGNGYRPGCGLSLDRIDVNGNYEPDNCRYASTSVQLVNRRPRRPNKKSFVTINGVTKTKREWCEEYGIWQATVDYRMKHRGMSFEEALTAEKMTSGNHHPALLDMQAERKKQLEDLNKINSYIECNLYMAFCRLTDRYTLLPQQSVGKYRVDFLVNGTTITVECDGHDVHKTKEQMAYDYRRERFLIANGYTVIRFTGSEINANPDGCAEELLQMIDTLRGEDKCQEQQTTKKILKSS